MKIILGLIVVAVVGIGGWFALTTLQTSSAIDALAADTRANLIAVKGGTFDAGNFEITVQLENGDREVRLVSTSALPAYTVTLDDFSMLAGEALNSSFDLFTQATGRPSQVHNAAFGLGIPDHPANMTWQEATAYCAWLGDIAGLSLRLPTEAEWEFAARSRGALVPWGTAGGVWMPGENVSPADAPDAVKDAANQWPASPMGFYDFASGAKEWVSATSSDARIAKGGSSRSDAALETIPGRTIVHAVTSSWPGEPDRLAQQGYPYHAAYATARCASDEAGQGSGTVDFEAPAMVPVIGAQAVSY
ncbi:SUMF1/EgtB/PvdO family nonheme iron enzyme [Yoonia sp.]|uniref:formylglycine-generating enzyme family protein n=1 Tax=Yoonia sp. TaxID=2212373 RepID=UPI003263DD52